MNSEHQLNSHRMNVAERLLTDLPSDPFEQLEIARRIAENAYKARVASLEKEVGYLRGGSDAAVLKLQKRVSELEKDLDESRRRLSRALEEQVKLDEERNTLVDTVKNLNREIVKLEAFKRTLMQQLEEDPEEDQKKAQSNGDPDEFSRKSHYSANSEDGRRSTRVESDQGESNGRNNSFESFRQLPESLSGRNRNSLSDHDSGLEGRLQGARILRNRPGSRSTAMTTPSLSPFFQSSQIATPRDSSKSASPRRHSGQSVLASEQGKQFFKEARRRLSFEDFRTFLENIKDLGAKRKTREETIRMASALLANDPELLAKFETMINTQKLFVLK